MNLDQIHHGHPGVSGCRAFTIAEIVLALGILSVAVVGILGLLNVAATTSRDSNLDTLVVSMAAQVTSDLKSSPFDALWFADPKEHGTNAAPALGTPRVPEDSVYYFTADGVLLSRNTPQQEAVYQCTVKKMPDEDTRGYGQTGYNLLKLQLLFQSPPGASGKSLHAKSIYTTVARY